MYEDLIFALRKRAHDLPEQFSKNALNIDLFMKAADTIEELQKKFVDFICKEVSEFMDGSDFCCDYLNDIDDTCYEQCSYSFAQPECWKRYFTEKMKEEEKSCPYCNEPLTEPKDGKRWCHHCHFWINEDGTAMEETRGWLKDGEM